MVKNKALYIEIISKRYLNKEKEYRLKTFQVLNKLQKTIFKNYSQKPFLKTLHK